MSTSSPQTIFPALRYDDAPRAIDFLETAFGFERQAVFAGPDQSIAHAELCLRSACIGLNSAQPPSPGNPWTTVRCGIYAVLPEAAAVEALAARAVASAARVAMPVRDTDYGSRECSIWDVEGHLWSFGTYTWAPPGDQGLSVGLQYRDAPAALEWLVGVFGFSKGLVVPGAGATIAHAELHWHGSVLMLGTSSSAAAWAGRRQGTSLVVDDPDAHHAQAVRAGATVVAPLADAPHGARGYTAIDLEGFPWTFSTYRPARLA